MSLLLQEIKTHVEYNENCPRHFYASFFFFSRSQPADAAHTKVHLALSHLRFICPFVSREPASARSICSTICIQWYPDAASILPHALPCWWNAIWLQFFIQHERDERGRSRQHLVVHMDCQFICDVWPWKKKDKPRVFCLSHFLLVYSQRASSSGKRCTHTQKEYQRKYVQLHADFCARKITTSHDESHRPLMPK